MLLLLLNPRGYIEPTHLGYKPAQRVTVQNLTRLIHVQEKVMQSRDVGKEMCEAAADVTWHTVLQKAFVLMSGKSTCHNNTKYSTVNA